MDLPLAFFDLHTNKILKKVPLKRSVSNLLYVYKAHLQCNIKHWSMHHDERLLLLSECISEDIAYALACSLRIVMHIRNL